ncbi:MAG TPA: PLDc N-terminal domain-containing protein [bacterium]|nr:PLDc N-terminal domain-containing protein [bacterium]
MTWLLSLVVFVLDIWALIKTWNSGATTGTKIAWTLVILLLPLLGLILWFFLGPKR